MAAAIIASGTTACQDTSNSDNQLCLYHQDNSASYTGDPIDGMLRMLNVNVVATYPTSESSAISSTSLSFDTANHREESKSVVSDLNTTYQTIANMLDETNKIKADLGRCQTENSKQKLALEVKQIENEVLTKKVSQLEQERGSKLDYQLLEASWRLSELKLEKANAENAKLNLELKEASSMRVNCENVLRSICRSMIDLRSYFEDLEKHLKLPRSKAVEYDIEQRIEQLMASIGNVDSDSKNERGCQSLTAEFKTMQHILEKVVQLSRSQSFSIPSESDSAEENQLTSEPSITSEDADIKITSVVSNGISNGTTPHPLETAVFTPKHPSSSNIKQQMHPSYRRRGPSLGEKKVHAVDKSLSHQGYFCTCSLNFRTKQYLEEHIKYFCSKKLFHCSFGCGQSFGALSYLKKHMRTKHKYRIARSSTGCRDCGACFSSRELLFKHRQIAHSGRKENITSPQASISILPNPKILAPVEKTPGASSTHVTTTQVNMESEEIHSNSDAPFTIAEELIGMLGPLPSSDHAEDKSKSHLGLYCICGKLCSRREALHHHLWYRNRQYAMTCTICHRSYPGRSYLNRHMLSAHRMVPVIPTGQILERNVKVTPGSGAVMSTPKNIRRDIVNEHYKTINNVHQECKHCGKIFETSSEHRCLFQENMSATTHSSTLDYHQVPDVIPRVDKYSDNDIHGLVEVIDLELGFSSSSLSSSKYACKCGKEFPDEQRLISHINSGLSRKVFRCQWCPNRYSAHSSLKKHIRQVHHQVQYTRKFGCKQCGSTFVSHSHLSFHLRNIHPTSHRMKV